MDAYAVLRLHCALGRFLDALECVYLSDHSSPCRDPEEASSPICISVPWRASSTCASMMIKLHGYALTRSGVSCDTC